MTKVATDIKNYEDIAAAIREKLNTDVEYLPSEMPDAIRTITRYPKLSDITISHNGTTIPDEGYDGFYEVTVDVPIIQGSITLTSNGFYNAIDDNVLGYRTVIVNTLNDDRVVDRTVDIYHNNEINNVRQYAFARCSNLYDISLPECEIIGNSAFIYCSNLSQVFFEKCKTIQTSAFANCFNLEKIEFPKCETIESYAFNNNYYSYYYAENVNTYYSQIFRTYYYNQYYYYSSTYTFETICSSYRKLTEISLPECLTIGQYAFECQGIEELSLPKVQNIGSSAFQNCQHLSKIALDECINLENNNAFMYCYNLHTVNLPKCEFIGNSHFIYCSGLQNIFAPECLSIGYNTFAACYNLSSINLPNCEVISQFAFQSCYNLVSISLPECSYISQYAFSQCSNLSTIILPSCKYIGNYAFRYCSALSMFILPASNIVQLQNSDAFANTPIRDSSYLGYYGSIYVPESLYQEYRVADKWDRLQLRLAHYEGTFNLPTDIEVAQLPNKLFYKSKNDIIDLTNLIIQAYLTTLESKNTYSNNDYPNGIIPNDELELKLDYNIFNSNYLPNNIKIVKDYDEYLCTINNIEYYYRGFEPILFCTVKLQGYNCCFLISNNEATLRYKDTKWGENKPWQAGTFTYNEVLYYIKIPNTYSGENIDFPIIGSANNIADLCRIYFNLSDEIEKFYTNNQIGSYIKISWPRPFDQVKLKTEYLIDIPEDLILKINQEPFKLNYYENEAIDFTGLEIETYFTYSNRKLNDGEIINGIIPHNNLIFPKTSAIIDKITFDSFSDWVTYLPQNTSITITNNQINIIGVSTSGIHEKLYKAVSVEKNTDYIFKLDFSSLPFEEISPYHAYFLVMKSAPPASGWFEDSAEVIEKTQILSNSNGEYSVVFNSGDNTTVYLVIDFAAFLDNMTFDLNFSNIQFYKIKNLLIPVQWKNPYNNNILETSFQINILDKPKANEMRIISMPNKINYFDSEEVDYTGLVIQAYDEYGNIWTNEGLYPNGIIPLDNLVLPETIAHINDLSWSAGEDWIVENVNEYLGIINDRRFTKSNNGKAITCFIQGSLNNWYGPTLISTDQNNIIYKVNNANISPSIVTVSYKYFTWYMNTNYYYQNPSSWDAPKNIINNKYNNWQEVLIGILDQANVKVEGTSVNTITISWRINSKVLTVPLNINVHARPDIKEIKIESLPRKIIYNDDDIIDYTGLIVKPYDSNDNIYTDSYYPTGEIPLNEIIFLDNKATYSKSRTGIANSLMQGNLRQPIQFHQGPGISRHINGNIYHDNQPPHVRVFTAVNSNTSFTTWWLSLKPFDIPRIIEQSDGTIITDILGSSKKYNYNGLLYYSYSITINENINNWTENYPLSYGIVSKSDLLTILYGDIELSYKQKINIQWKHPFDTYRCSTSFDIYVEPQISKIDFIKNPDKKIYINEDNIDYSGLIVKAYDENGNLWEENNYYNGIIPLEEFTVLNPGATYYYPSYFVNSQTLVRDEGIICENNGERSPITKVNNEESICFIVTDAGGNDYGGNWIFVFSIGFTDSAAKLTSPNIGNATIQIDGITYYIYWSGSNASYGGATEFYNPLNLPVFNGKVININSNPTTEQLKYMLELVDFSTNIDSTNITQIIYLLWENPNNGYISVISYPVIVIADKNAFSNKDISLAFLTALHKLH